MDPHPLISIRALHVGYDQTDVLKGVDLDIAAGEMIALLGGSGCGKTTLLRTLAGFTPARSGSVTVNGQDVLRQPPERRGMAMVFQSYALWPHMTVAQNIAYGLRLRGMARAEIARRTEDKLTLLGLAGFGQRRVTQLSGGQRQRVALGRALAVEPEILLLDEPLSNLDAGIRQQMRHEIRALQKQLGLTAILVTHDREEALAMADRVVILNQGRVEQVGTPEQVFHQPATPYVAAFMGAANTISCETQRDADAVRFQVRPDTAGAPLVLLELPAQQLPADAGSGAVSVHFSSDAASLHPPHHAPSETLCLPGRVGHSSFLGGAYRCEVQTVCGRFLVDHSVRLEAEQDIVMCVPAPVLHVFPQYHPGPAC